MKHLLYLKELNQSTISKLLAKAETFLSTNNFPLQEDKNLQGTTLANLFLEPSTRTKSSFQIAAKRLGADVLNIDDQHSARVKGESIIDTIRTLEAMGKKLALIAPEEFKPNMEFYPKAEHYKNLDQGLVNADVVVALRVQKERIESLTKTMSPDNYFEKYGLTKKRLQPCNEDVIVMHPGPVNRGVEISDEVADGTNSVIREQVTNGIAIRMALLSMMQAEVMK